MNQPQHQKESAFHDNWAESVNLKDILVREAFESPTALENRFICKLIGDLRGKRILDVGCGLGESSVYFALQGAEVTASDISPGMIEVATNLARFHGVMIHGIVAAGEELNLSENYFDIVYVANTMHHVADKEKLLGQLQRTLKPGGRFFSWDPLAYNPVINIYRRIATDVRTEDEAPLSFQDLKIVRKYFCRVQHREFWILALTLFLKYFLIDRIHPNEKRYWKLIYEETRARLWWWQPLARLDELLTRTPLVRRLGWNMVIWGEKE